MLPCRKRYSMDVGAENALYFLKVQLSTDLADSLDSYQIFGNFNITKKFQDFNSICRNCYNVDNFQPILKFLVGKFSGKIAGIAGNSSRIAE